MSEDSALKLTDLPDLDDRQAFFAFAMTSNGYVQFGTREASVAAARVKARDSVAHLRNELFFSDRASRHTGSDKYLTRYAELLPYFRTLITR